MGLGENGPRLQGPKGEEREDVTIIGDWGAEIRLFLDVIEERVCLEPLSWGSWAPVVILVRA